VQIDPRLRFERSCQPILQGRGYWGFPYFIGVFDTVAALGNRWLAPILIIAVIAIPFGLVLRTNRDHPQYQKGPFAFGDV